MKTNFRIVLIVIVLICVSCSQQPVKNHASVKGIVLDEVKAINLSDFAEDMRFIPLEHQPDALFANADKIIIKGDNVFILDKILKAVLCFDTAGKFRFRIQRIGKGPGEYTELNGICIKPAEKKLILHSRMPPKLMTYDFTGHYVKEVRSFYGANDITEIGQNLLACFNILRDFHGIDSIPTGIFLLRENGAFVSQVKEVGKYTSYFAVNYQSNLTEYEGGALVLSQSDTIYRLDSKGRVSVDFILDLGDWRMPDDLRAISTMDPRQAEVFAGEHLQTKDQLVAFGPIRFFSFTRKNVQHFAMINLAEGKGYYSTVIRNDLTVIPTMFPIGVSDRNELIGILDMNLIYAIRNNLDSYGKDQKSDDKYRLISDFVNQAISNDQPVIYLARIKKQWLNSN